jgi:hypothetical protein
MKRLLVVPFLLVFTLAACAPQAPATATPDIVQTALVSTMNVINEAGTQNAAVTQTQMAQVTPTENATATPQPTLTPLQPTQPAAMLTLLERANCRLGVYKFWPSIQIFEQGQTAAVIGQNMENGLWWQVQSPNGQCWIAGDLVSVTGDTSKVPTVQSPATPTPVPAPTWQGKWKFRLSSDVTDPDGSSQLYTVTLAQKASELTGSITATWSGIYMIGYVSADGMRVSGELYPSLHPDKQYRFYLFRNSDNLSQFRGYYYIEGEGIRGNFCGVVFDGTLPLPCQP